jgi:hypothetical protein
LYKFYLNSKVRLLIFIMLLKNTKSKGLKQVKNLNEKDYTKVEVNNMIRFIKGFKNLSFE